MVYCEMQGRENSEGSLVDRACMELLYPTGRCGYSAETGGKMENLRSLTVEKVRRYHAEYYRSENVILVMSGNVVGEEFFGALDEVGVLILQIRINSKQSEGHEVYLSRKIAAIIEKSFY